MFLRYFFNCYIAIYIYMYIQITVFQRSFINIHCTCNYTYSYNVQRNTHITTTTTTTCIYLSTKLFLPCISFNQLSIYFPTWLIIIEMAMLAIIVLVDCAYIKQTDQPYTCILNMISAYRCSSTKRKNNTTKMYKCACI